MFHNNNDTFILSLSQIIKFYKKTPRNMGGAFFICVFRKLFCRFFGTCCRQIFNNTCLFTGQFA